VDIYDDGYNARSGFDVHVRKVVYNDGNNTLAVNNMIFRFPPRKPDDEYGESHRVADGFPVISYVEPCIVVNSDHWRLSYLSREIPQDGGGVFTSDSIDGGKTWGAVSCIKQGCAQLQAFGAYGETSYIASVIYEENWPQLPIGRVLRGWPDDEYDKNTERDYIPYSGKLWITKINANIGKPFTQLIDQNEDVNGVAILALKNVVYIVYARGDSSKGSLWVVKSMGNDKWSKPAQLTADKKCLDREPCITQFNNEILVAYSRSYNGKASVIECIKISDILLQEDK
jgi:hypothetical protein